MGYQFSEHFAPLIFQRFDTRKTGNLQFDSFVHSILLIQKLTSAFQPFDIHRNGNANFTYEQFLTVVIQNL